MNLFDTMYKKLLEILEGNASEARKYEAIEEFAEIFVNYDTSKFDKYFK